MADTIKCPNCGSNLTLNADTQKLECPNCGSTFDPNSLAVTVEELEAKKAEPTDPAQSQQPQGEEQPQGAPEQTEFVCNACGAKLVTDAHTAATSVRSADLLHLSERD